MGVLQKGRRRLRFHDQSYVWYVQIGQEDNFYYLHIVSADKAFIAAYPLGQCEKRRQRHFIIAKGKRFQGKALDGRWNRFYTPPWEDTAATPGLVRKILSWCEEEGAAEAASYGDEGVFA